MELRGCSQVHFISVISGGKVIKMHNIARGKSALKFKNIEQIYDSNGSKCQESLLRQPPKVNRSLAMANGVDKANIEVKNECVEEESELDFGRITLRQLKRTSKSMKRKATKSIKLAAVKQEVSDVPCEEDELELKETLVSWKRKVKKSKSKKKKTSIGLALSEVNSFGCISEDTPSRLALVDISSEIYYPLQIKVEEPELNPIQPQAVSFVLSDDNWNSTSEMAGTVECCSSDQALKTNLGDSQRGYLSQCFHGYSVQPGSVDISNCVLNQISYDLIEHMGHGSTISESSSIEDMRMTEGLVVTDQPSVCCGSEMPKEEDMSDPITCDESPERVLPDCNPFVFREYHPQSFESEAATGEENLEASLDEFTSVVDEKEISVADVTSTELHASSCQNGDIEEVVLGRHLKDFSPTGQDSKFSPSTVASLPSTTCVVEDERSPVDNYSAPQSCSPVIQPSNSIEILTGSALRKGNENAVMPHPPERLFSARKIISPICQERLRKAMNFDEQQDDVKIQSCKERLSFEKNGDRSALRPGVKRAHTAFSCKSPESMNAVEIQAKGRKRMRKAKVEGKVPHSRGSVNSTQASPMSQNVDNVCSSVQMCSQNAIAFSKRQIHDIERLATKLMTGLQSMKSIVIDALQHESRTGAKFRYNTDKVRLAVENVGKVEDTAQRWLSMMSRDCDRFCKIMRLAEADAPSPEKAKGKNLSSPDTKTVPKERKIMFADEAGGSLCNVKVFKNFETDMDIDTPVKQRLAEADAPSPEEPKGENLSSPYTKTVPKERKIMFADEAGRSLCKVKVFKNFETDMDVECSS